MSKKKVLVTGASGFLGSHISEAAHEAGYDVHALVRSTSSTRWLKHPWLTVHSSELDDWGRLSKILPGMDAVIHNAGALWGDYHKVNTDYTRAFAQECIKSRVKKFVYISSIAAGGPCEGPYPRKGNEPDIPCSPYGKSKKAAEEYLESMSSRLDVVILRFPMIYGPRDAQGLRLFKSFNYLINPGVGLRHRYISVVYVQDAARSVIKALEARVPSGSVYNISDGAPYTFNTLYKIVGKVWRRWALRVPVPFVLIVMSAWFINDFLKAKTAFNPEQINMFQRRFWLISPQRAVKDLGWKPEVNIYEGVRRTVSWYKEHGWL